ncbi:MAG: sigma 54-interacting transcriptional regulator [Gammaproteobacteria bacterium]|nr:sigma 54-interacting transcriptional regulator [Gammaproteobacteria bacterium]
MDTNQENALLAIDELIKIGTSLSSERDLNHLLNMVVSAARRITCANGGMVYLLNSTKTDLQVEVLQNDTASSAGARVANVALYVNGERNSGNVIAHCVFSGQPVQIGDIYQYSGFNCDELYEYDRVSGARTHALLALPLRNHEAVAVGVLVLTNIPNAGRAADPQDPLLRAFASQAAVAIDNVQLIETNKRLIDILDHTNRELEEENRRLRAKIVSRYDFSKIIGHGAAMKKVFSLLEKVLASPATVLIRGETGTGKELFAQTVHFNSPRRGGEFVAQNCAALPDNLLESELFGYKKGAFSGAMQDKKGLIELANGGTLFLDEIGDMPLGFQAKLLRVLQEKEVRPLGGVESKKIDVRVVAATHCNLEEKIKKGEFREDLYYRLSVFPIDVPPLRARKDDVPALAKYFVDEFARVYGKEVSGFAPRAFDCLFDYDFPGNVRELKNVIERAVLLCEPGGSILPEHLPEQLHCSERLTRVVPKAAVDRDAGLKELVEEFEQGLLREKLQACNWNQTRTAEQLRIGRRTLIEKITKYQIKR